MDFDTYQEKIKNYDLFDETTDLKSVNFIEKVLGLSGEAGEVSDKIKKLLRDKDGVLTDTDRTEIKKELGDTLWYLASVARYLGISLSDVAASNIKKLESRKSRNLLHGSGDNR